MLDEFPLTQYRKVNMVDITRRLVIHNEIKENDSFFQGYVIRDGELPEDIAFNFYGDSNYNLLILMMNDIIDPYYDWCLSNKEFNKYVVECWGQDKLNDIHHYELNGDYVHKDTIGAKKITNYDFSFNENENKRRINILKPEYLEEFMEEFIREINIG